MNILIVTDAYPPMRTSCATQIYDLAQAFKIEGCDVDVIVPNSELKKKIDICFQDGVRLIQVKAFETKDVNYVRRTLAEFFNPFLIWHYIKFNPTVLQHSYVGIVWYSPTIFWGPLVKRLKKHFHAKAYLVLRDIFPDWALDLGIINQGLIYQFLKSVARYQYCQADVIGVQSPNNEAYFKNHNPSFAHRVQVLWNWVGEIKSTPCSIDFSKTSLAGRKIFIYAGNMGVAQGMDTLITLADVMRTREDLGFAFVGRGSEVVRLKSLVKQKGLTNTLFFDEIEPTEIANLYKQCAIGMISLDHRHNTHNIPGKAITYLQAGLPIWASINPGNDLAGLIESYHLGYICKDISNENLLSSCKKLVNLIQADHNISQRCQKIASEVFSSINAAKHIIVRFNK